MLPETPAQLVAHLEHPNGWWRDTAQKLLVLKGDKSVIPALTQIARTGGQLARIHALWTLEGLDSLDTEVIRAFLKDPDAQLRAQGIRVAERLVLTGDTTLIPDVQALAKDNDPGVVLQVLMTGKLLSTGNSKLWPDYSKFAQQTMLVSASPGLKTLGTMLLTGADKVGGQEFTPAEIATLEKGQAIFKEVCFACHGFDGKGMPMDGLRPGTTIAPPLAGSPTVRLHPDAVPLVLLNGLGGPVAGKTYDAQMVPMNSNNDEWIADIASYVRNAFGNHGALVSAADVKTLREASARRTEPWTVESLRAAVPQLLPTAGWKVSASENTESAGLLIDGKSDTRWQTAGDQKQGQWVQVELPTETMISGLRLDQWKAQGEGPKFYRLEVSRDGQKWTRVAERSGMPGATENFFPPIPARYVKVTLTGPQRGKPLTIYELELFAGNAADGH
jgi:mono/diheme cytochrome c family protein